MRSHSEGVNLFCAMLRCNKRVLVENNLLIARAQEPSLLTLSGERERHTHTHTQRWEKDGKRRERIRVVKCG
jgi:hypothetical protein